MLYFAGRVGLFIAVWTIGRAVILLLGQAGFPLEILLAAMVVNVATNTPLIEAVGWLLTGLLALGFWWLFGRLGAWTRSRLGLRMEVKYVEIFEYSALRDDDRGRVQVAALVQFHNTRPQPITVHSVEIVVRRGFLAQLARISSPQFRAENTTASTDMRSGIPVEAGRSSEVYWVAGQGFMPSGVRLRWYDTVMLEMKAMDQPTQRFKVPIWRWPGADVGFARWGQA